jgi:tRNA(His) 5'-end guanylyltransferase
MNADAFEAKLRKGETFHGLRVLDGAWIIVRMDGRSFSKMTVAAKFEKPFDSTFHKYMLTSCKHLMKDFHPIFIYTESDEISMLLPRDFNMFDREVEKIVSVSASVASAAFTMVSGRFVSFDSRIWVGVLDQDVIDYFRWRQADSERCCLNGYAYHLLRGQGNSAKKTASILDSKGPDFRHDVLHSQGMNFNNLPLWHRRGTMAYREVYEKKAVNKATGEPVVVKRSGYIIDEQLPMKDEFSEYVRDKINPKDV